MRARLVQHWPLGIVLVIAAGLLLTNLGQDYLWSDEGDTAVLAKSILTFGVPTAWDGVTFTDSDFGARLTDNFVMVSHPWLQYYVTAAAFALFGPTTLAARLPFALIGLATIALVYLMALRVTRNRWTATSAAILLTLSVQFLIYARQSRHYSLNAALTCLLLLQFSRLNSWTNSLVFALVSILLFHSHPIGIVPLLALGALTLFYAPFRPQRAWFWRAMPIVALFTLPWLVVAQAGYGENTALPQNAGVLIPRLAQFVVECASVTSIIGLAVLFLAVRRRAGTIQKPSRGRKRRTESGRTTVFTPEERGLAVAVLGTMLAYAAVMALTQPRDMIWTVGVRYTPAVLPFMAMLAALLIAKASGGRWRPWVALLLVFGFTKIGRLTPWTFWQEPRVLRDQAAAITFHYPEHFVDRVFRTGQLNFVRSLFRPNPGTTAQIVEFLNRHATDRDIVVTNYGWEPLYFHTGLRQGLKVLPSYPIYEAARAHQLPDYVFSADGARWIVWRRAWGAYRGQALERVLEQMRENGIPVTLMATFPETMWENRENIHFRRFADERYIFPWYSNVPTTLIFRVDGAATGTKGGGAAGLR